MPAHAVAPEICVEGVSPSNTQRKLDEEREWYFDAGAEEVWRCSEGGQMSFFLKAAPKVDAGASMRCPDFPAALA
ncbi:MAG: hypothetical protein ACFB21_07745 [Opitutales bacterium]